MRSHATIGLIPHLVFCSLHSPTAELPSAEMDAAWAVAVESELETIKAARAAAKAEAEELARKRFELGEGKRREARAVRARQLRHVLYTVPEEVRAGGEVEIHYNPNNTNLRGNEQIFVNGGFNRWQHPQPFTCEPGSAPQ